MAGKTLGDRYDTMAAARPSWLRRQAPIRMQRSFPVFISVALAAAALVLGASDASALGLGTIQVNSRLNQVLNAEIPVIQESPGEAAGLIVQMASPEDFERVGLNRSQTSVPLNFSVVKNARGETVVKITSKDIVTAPFLDFLIEANWANGRVLREYTVLLDPPSMAPVATTSSAPATAARASAAPAPSAPVASAPTPPKAAVIAPAAPAPAPPRVVEAKPAPVKPAPPAAVTPPQPAPAPKAAETRPLAAAKPLPPTPGPKPVAKAPAAPAAAHAPTPSTYGPVASGETLSEIAKATTPDNAVSINQVMLALLKANPDAFFGNNINNLKRGAILRIPGSDEIEATATMRAAAARVHTQIAQWRAASSQPTLIAGSQPASGSSATKSSTTTTKADAHLALVPPKVGKDSLAADDRVGGTASANGKAGSSSADLARAREALSSREQEAGELRSRVKDLEDIKQKNERLLSLKNSEIADLQRKLAEVQGGKPAASVATPAAATAATGGEETKTSAPSSRESATSPSAPSASEPSKAATSPAEASESKASEPKASSDDIWGKTANSEPNTTPVAPPVTTGEAQEINPQPVATTATSPAAATTSAPTAGKPWYLNMRTLGIAGLVALVAILLGIVAMRRRATVATAPRGASISDQYADATPAPYDHGHDHDPDIALANEREEQFLHERIAQDPTDLGARLELLSMYYADSREDEFVAGAEQMHEYVEDPNEPEWRQVVAMGEDIAPHHHLFNTHAEPLRADVDAEDHHTLVATSQPEQDRWAPAPTHATHTPAFDALDADSEDLTEAGEPADAAALDFAAFHDDDAAHNEFDLIDDDFVDQATAAPVPAAAPTRVFAPISGTGIGTRARFDLDPVPPAPGKSGFRFDLPPIESLAPHQQDELAGDIDHAAHGTADHDIDQLGEDEFFVNDDTYGTKLDLARAYVDMGDPDGARSMLEEVLSDGNDEQQDQARKLLAGIG